MDRWDIGRSYSGKNLEQLEEARMVIDMDYGEYVTYEDHKAEIDEYKSLLLDAHRLLMKGRKLSSTPTEVLNWTARLSALAKHKGE